MTSFMNYEPKLITAIQIKLHRGLKLKPLLYVSYMPEYRGELKRCTLTFVATQQPELTASPFVVVSVLAPKEH